MTHKNRISLIRAKIFLIKISIFIKNIIFSSLLFLFGKWNETPLQIYLTFYWQTRNFLINKQICKHKEKISLNLVQTILYNLSLHKLVPLNTFLIWSLFMHAVFMPNMRVDVRKKNVCNAKAQVHIIKYADI